MSWLWKIAGKSRLQIIRNDDYMTGLRGHPFMTSTKNRVLIPPPSCPHASTWARHPLPLLWMSTCGRYEIHITLLKRLVQGPSGPKAEIRLLVIFITILYRRQISTFYSVQRRNSGKKDANFAWEEDRMTSVDSNFNFLCGRAHGSWPPRPHASTWAWSLPPPCGRHKWMAPK